MNASVNGQDTVEQAPRNISQSLLANFVTFKKLLSDPVQPILWTVENVLYEDTCGFIIGPPGAGKSWVALQLLISVSTGRPFLDRFKVTKPCPTLYFAKEGSQRNFQKRIHALAVASNVSPDELSDCCFLSHDHFKLPQDELAIKQVIKSFKIRLAIFDSFRRFHSERENFSEDLQPVLESFTRIKDETKCSILIIHHLNKGSKEKGNVFERMRGSSDLWAWRDILLALEPEEADPNKAKLSTQFRDAEPLEPLYVVREKMPNDGLLLRVEEMDQEDDFKAIASDIRTRFEQHGALSKTRAIEDIPGRKQTKLSVINWLIRKGILVQEGKLWKLAEIQTSSE